MAAFDVWTYSHDKAAEVCALAVIELALPFTISITISMVILATRRLQLG